jgi:putative ABC transport system substrate-binding protein
VTGGTDFGKDLVEKHVDLVHSLVPNASRIAVLMSDNQVHPLQLQIIQHAANRMRLTILPTVVRAEANFEQAYVSMVKQRAGALILFGGAPVSTRTQVEKIIALSARSKLPTLYPGRGFVDLGGLLSYGPSWPYRARTAATYVDRILKGAKPADLPVEQPTEFELVINMKTAKALGLTIPPSLLLRADQIIQ